MTSNVTAESYTVQTTDGIKLHTTVFESSSEETNNNNNNNKNNIVIVLVHPYSVLGGCQGLLRGIASKLASEGYKAVTFDMRGVGCSTGKPSLTGSKEVNDVTAVCHWVSHYLGSHNRVLLVGSSAGAPISGSAVDKLEQVAGYVSLGYPFGLFASILFGRHHKAILKSPKPKLFVMGTNDCFTTVKQLKKKLNSASGHVETHLMEGISHFQMEGPEFDDQIVILILKFIAVL